MRLSLIQIRRQSKRSLTVGLTVCVAALTIISVSAQQIGSTTFPLSVGTVVPVGQYAAVGTVPGCTATLIDQETVLTAAHCVCADEGPSANLGTCTGRTTFTLHDVIPTPDPSTPWLIPTSRTDVSIDGTVYVHPEYGQTSWLFYDIAIIKLDVPVNERVRDVQPIPIERVVPNNIGETVTMVGYGRIGSGCTQNNAEKRTFSTTIDDCGPLGILMNDATMYVCPGDSGSPLINAQGRIIGVASHGDASSGNSTYRPLYSSSAWISRFLRGRWTQIRGPVQDVILGLNTIESFPLIYVTDRATGDIESYDGVSWNRVGGPGQMFAVAGAGTLYGLTLNGMQVKRFSGSATGWAAVGGGAEEIFGAVDQHPGGLYATNPVSGDLMAYDGSSWSKVSSAAEQFAFGSNGVIYRIDDGGGAVSRYHRLSGQWTQIGGPAGEIYAAANSLYATNPQSGDLYQYDDSASSWTRIGGAGKMFAVGDDDHLYGLAPDGGAVFQYLGVPNRWMEIGGAADAIYAIGDTLVATQPNTHELWRYTKQ